MQMLISVVVLVLQVYNLMIMACVILSWLPELQNNNVAKFLSRAVDPVLAPARKMIPAIGNVDISAIVVLVLIQLAIRGLS